MSEQFVFEEEEFSTRLTGKTLVRIAGLARSHIQTIITFFVAMFICAGLDAVFTFITKRLIDEGIQSKDFDIAIRLMGIYLAISLIQAVGVFTFIYSAGILGERIRYDLRQKMFNHLQRLSLSYYSRTPVGWIMSRVTSDSERVADLITWGLLDSTWGVVSIITSMGFMLYINWRLALIVLAILPLLLYAGIQFRKLILKEFRNVRKFNSRITGAINENITGVRVVKALTREDENLREFSIITGDMYKSAYKAAWLSALFLPTVQIITAIALGVIVWYGGGQARVGNLSIGGIQAFISYLTFMMWPIQDLARVFAELQQSIASAERIFSMIDAIPDISDQPQAFDPGSLRGDIVFDEVSFTYENDDSLVLRNFSLHVQHGETIALVGSTGGGKTTIINLLCRFYEPQQGKIWIDGTDYTQFTLHGIQSRIGMVPQTPHLFSGTIAENIAYGRLDATPQEIEHAAQLVGAQDFIRKFEKGFEQQVGEGGNMLSVGQKQLISLARAILADPEIFIMDEATSSVDTLTEALIQKGMQVLMKDRTSFIIAHRLSTIKNANRILVIEGGQIAESGSHAELLRLKGKYYHLYTNQFRNQMEQTYAALLPAD